MRWMTGLLIVLAVGLGVYGLLSWGDGGGGASGGVPLEPREALTGSGAEQPGDPGRVASVPFPGGRERKGENPATPGGPGQTVITGRCVDADGKSPLPGCRVSLQGIRGRAVNVRKAAEKAPAAWKDPEPVATGRDGRFRLSFVGLERFRYVVSVQATGRVTKRGVLQEIAPGSVTDLGDLVMHPGVRVTGSVADTHGDPVGAARVELERSGVRTERNRMADPGRTAAVTDQDGRFALFELVIPGQWTASVRHRQLASPAGLDLDGSVPEAVLEIRVRALDEVPSITGVVVDQDGRPVSRAFVHYDPMSAGEHSIILTRRDGTFRVERQADEDSREVFLTVTREGHEGIMRRGPIPWDTHDLRLVMTRGGGGDLLVVDGRNQEPVTGYGYLCFPDPLKGGMRSSEDFRLRDRGSHPGGATRVRSPRPGANVLIVVPQDGKFCTSAPRRFQSTADGAEPLTVEVYPRVSRLLKVATRDGSAVAGTDLQLLQALTDEAPDLDSRVLTLETLFNLGPGAGLAVCSGKTDEQGTFLLQGPPKEPLHLLLRGPGHQPTTMRDVRLDVADDLVATVAAGATLQGRVTPGELASLLRVPESAFANVRRKRSLNSYKRQQECGLTLGRKGPGPKEYPLGDGRIAISGGRYRIEGIPPGSWTLRLSWSEALPARTIALLERNVPVARVEDLKDGETRDLDLDLSRFVPGSLEGRVLLDGEPAPDAQLSLSGFREGLAGKRESLLEQGIRTDSGGRFSAALQAGRYRLLLVRSRPGRVLHLPANALVTVGAGQKVQQTFQVETGSLSLVFLRSDGVTPAEGVETVLEMADSAALRARTFGMPESSADGRTASDLLPAGTFVLKVWPRGSGSPRERYERARAQGKQVGDLMLSVGEVTVGRGGEAQRIVLPRSSGW